MNEEAMIILTRSQEKDWGWKIYDESAAVIGQQANSPGWAECMTEIIKWLEPGFAVPAETMKAAVTAAALTRRGQPTRRKVRQGQHRETHTRRATKGKS